MGRHRWHSQCSRVATHTSCVARSEVRYERRSPTGLHCRMEIALFPRRLAASIEKSTCESDCRGPYRRFRNQSSGTHPSSGDRASRVQRGLLAKSSDAARHDARLDTPSKTKASAASRSYRSRRRAKTAVPDRRGRRSSGCGRRPVQLSKTIRLAKAQ
jgi:hypothetical protein